LINVATRQILLSDSVTVSIPSIAPTTFESIINTQETLTHLVSGATAQVVPSIVMRMFPITVVSRNGGSVVLNQGGEIVREHASYQVVLMGDEIKDPQTGQSLGRTEEPCCVVAVDRVTATMSYGTLRNVEVNLDHVLPGGLQLRKEVLASGGSSKLDEPSTGAGPRSQTNAPSAASRVQPSALQPAAEPSDASQKAAAEKSW
jgi:hypothetical protein